MIFLKILISLMPFCFIKISALSEVEKENLWKALLNRDLTSFYNKSNQSENFKLDIYSDEDFDEGVPEAFNEAVDDYSKSVNTFSNELNKDDEKNSSENLIRNNRQYNYEEHLELLKKVNPYFSISLSKTDRTKDKLLVRHTKNGAQILEDPTFEEILTSAPKPGQKSLVIVFDGTGSMHDDLEQMTQGAEAIIQEFIQRDDNPIFNYIFVPFRDPYIGPKFVTQDLNKFLRELRNVPLFGGGDCPESSVGGINLAIEAALPKPFIFVFTDATAGDYGLDKEAIDLIQKHQATVTFLLTGDCASKHSEGYKVYEKLASISNGEVYNLKKTDIREVLQGIRTNLNANQIPLHYLHSNEPGLHKFDVPVDKNLKTFTVSVAGENPSINIIDPSLSVYEDAKEILNLERLKILNIEDPAPGNWNVETEADSEHSIKFTAMSDLNFHFGFTLKNPKFIDDTNIFPVLLLENILAISPSDDALVHNLTTVELFLITESPDLIHNITIPLTKIGVDYKYETSIYATNPFLPPYSMFKIYVNGFDMKGNPLKHLLSTAIKAVKGDAPRIINAEDFIEISEGEDIFLECKINTLAPVRVTWIRNNKYTDGISDNEDLRNLPYKFSLENAKIEDSGSYICKAENENGYDTKNFQLIVKENIHPLMVNVIQKHIIVTEGDVDYQISCVATPTQNINFQWLYNGDKIINTNIDVENENLLLKRIHRNNAGNYTCVATNKKISNSDSTYLEVQYGSEFIRPDDEDISIFYGYDISLDCEAFGNPTPTVEWTPPNLTVQNFKDGKIWQFSAKNEGRYHCTVDNGIGSVKQKSLLVTGMASAPPIIKTEMPSTIRLDAGSSYELTCECTSCEPIIYSSWTKYSKNNEIEVEKLEGSHANYNTENEKVFKYYFYIQNLTKNDQGTYSCNLQNEHGFDERTINIEVLEPPTINLIRSANSLEVDPYTFKATRGQTISFFCDAIGSPDPEINWFKENITLNDFSSKNPLILSDINSTDSGNYKCVASNTRGSASRNFLFYVMVPPKLKSSNETVIMIQDDDEVSMECDVIGNPIPVIQWKYNNRTIEKSEEYYTFYDSSLLFKATFKDNGIYSCEAKNEAGSVIKNFVLIVFVPPTIEGFDKAVLTNTVGENILLSCRVRGYPVPDILWRFSNESEKDLEIPTNFQKNGELLLRNINASDEGTYNCEASNEYGVAHKTIYLAVNYPPKIVSLIPAGEEIKLKPGESVKLICKGNGKPDPNIYWENLSKNTFVPMAEGMEIQISNINKNVSGTYTCVAKNSVGHDKKSVEIIALTNPRLMKRGLHERTINSTQGQQINLYCPIDNADYFVWKINNYVIVNESEQILKLTNVSSKDRGNYTCSGVNEAGTESYTQTLIVYSSPNIQLSSQESQADSNIAEILVRKGENRTLKCLPKGFPQPEIHWKKDETVLSNKTELNLVDIDIIHSGDYICQASNEFGTDEFTFNVRVLVAPTTQLPRKTWIEPIAGENLNLECEIYGNPWPSLYWTKDGLNLTNEYQEILKLSNVGLDSRGLYKCIAENHLGINEIEFEVDVMVPPKFSLQHIKDEIVITDKEDLELTCTVQGNPPPILAWAFNNKILLSTSRISNFDKNNNFSEEFFIDINGNTFSYSDPNEIFGSLLWQNEKRELYGKVKRRQNEVSLTIYIEDEKKKKTGDYSCYAMNSVGSNQNVVSVQIYSQPKLRNTAKSKEQMALLEGLPMILSCPWLGNPSPNISWFKDANFISNNIDIFVSHDMKTLTIFSAHQSDSGVYVCIGKNVVGENRKEFIVDILSPPKLRLENYIEDIPNEPRAYRHMSGQKTILECPVSGNPTPQVFWLKESEDNRESELLFDSSTELILNNIEESGTYSCYANNTLGFVEKKFTVQLLKYPKIENNYPSDLEGEEFATVSIKCPADGSPKPEIFWYKEGFPIDFNTGNSYYLLDAIELNIPKAFLNHSGTYSCVARNELGESRKDFKLTIKASVFWSKWEQWTPCSVSCDSGIKYRRRRCVRFNGEPALYENDCEGNNIESSSCDMPPCPVDGNWTVWSDWTSCSAACWDKRIEKPNRKRYRDCNSPIPKYGGKPCYGDDFQEEECNTKTCAIDGEWSNWSQWSSCSVTCGTGVKERTRLCNNPTPDYDGEYCKGSNKTHKVCNKDPCPINGGWSDWSSWSECSQTCGIGFRKRSRLCNNPSPKHGGEMCIGSNIEVTKCKRKQCQNSDLLKNLPNKKKYPSQKEYQTPIYYEKDDDDIIDSGASGKFEYATGHIKVIENYDNEVDSFGTEYQEPEDSTVKMIVKVKNYKPLDKDLTEISFHPGKAPYVISRILPCPLGLELNQYNECIDIDECKLEGACKDNEICTNLEAGYDCSCKKGFQLNEGSEDCEDKNECLELSSHNCSHQCNNIPESYFCSCPKGFKLGVDLKTCETKQISSEDDFMSDIAIDMKNSSIEKLEAAKCIHGYEKINRKCEDIDECALYESDCDENQSCLNTNGAYLCLPTDCPPEYKRGTSNSQCVLMCNDGVACREDSKIAQIITHTMLSLKNITREEPFLKIVNYDINRRALPLTRFSLNTEDDATLFKLETFLFNKAIAYLYAGNGLQHQKLYNITVNAKSYDQMNLELIYTTEFVIFLYVF